MKSRGESVADVKRTIGQLAEAAGVNIETVRYYHRRGLIPLPPKRAGGRRNYPDSALRQIVFIRRAQQLGFTLEDLTTVIVQGFKSAFLPFREKADLLEAVNAEIATVIARFQGAGLDGPDPAT